MHSMFTTDRGCIFIYSGASYNDEFELSPEGRPWEMGKALHWLDNNTLWWLEYDDKKKDLVQVGD